MAVGIIAADFQRSAFKTGDFAGRFLQHFDLEFFGLAVTQVHAFEDGCPVLRLGAAGARLDVEKTIIGVHFAGEHAAKFHFGDGVFQVLRVFGHGKQGGVVGFLACHVEQLLRVTQASGERGQRVDGVFERLTFLAELLCAFAVTPDSGVFGQPYDFIQTIAFGVVVKDTSAAPPCVIRYRRAAWRWR